MATCDAVIVTCMDFRLQKFEEDWARQNLDPEGRYDRVALPGGVLDAERVLNAIEISHRLHHVRRVILVNHEDCGAYPATTTAETHAHDLTQMAARISELYPDLDPVLIERFYLHLDGTWEPVAA